jgi:hypothetical protein
MTPESRGSRFLVILEIVITLLVPQYQGVPFLVVGINEPKTYVFVWG